MNRFGFRQSMSAVIVSAIVAAMAQAQTDDYLLVTSANPDTDGVKRYNAFTGTFVDDFVTRKSGGLNVPFAAILSPHDGSLLVASGHFGGQGLLKAVLRYDGTTGAFVDQFVPQGQLAELHALTFGPDGNLYVGDRPSSGQGRIARFDGVTGAYINDFVAPASGGLGHPLAHVFGPSGTAGQLDLYVTDVGAGGIARVLRYEGTTGTFLGTFVETGSGGLGHPFGLTFGPDGDLYVANAGVFGGPPAVLRFQGPAGSAPGEFIDAFVPPGSGDLLQPVGILFGPDANGDDQQDLYVNSQEINPGSFYAQPHTSSVKRFDGVTGAFIDTFIPIGSGNLQGPNLMTFAQTDPVTLNYLGVSGPYAEIHGVPEPSCLLLASFGAVAAALSRCKRRRS